MADPKDKELDFIEIPVEKIIDGEVVVVDTKAVPVIPPKKE